MPLRRCCRVALNGEAATCGACGADLTAMRAEMQRLLQPSATWTGEVLIPAAPFRRLKPSVRAELGWVIRKAVKDDDAPPR